MNESLEIKHIVIEIIKGACFFIMMAFCYLMLDLTIPYLIPPFATDIEFLATKQDVIDLGHWKFSFYVHIVASFLVLFLGVFQFSKWLMKNKPLLHRNIGKIYVVLILFITAPSGLIMAYYANGGITSQLGFITQAILWWSFTYLAYKKAINKDLISHGKWMLRSYAMTMSAITLRAVSFIAGWVMIPIHYEKIYAFSAWSGWGFNLIIAEILIGLGLIQYYFKK